MLMDSVPCDARRRLLLVWTPSVRSQGCPNRPRKYENKKENKIIYSAQSHSVIYARVVLKLSWKCYVENHKIRFYFCWDGIKVFT